MRAGFSPVFMNTSVAMSDLECFRHELRLCDLAEPLGFDSIWQCVACPAPLLRVGLRTHEVLQ